MDSETNIKKYNSIPIIILTLLATGCIEKNRSPTPFEIHESCLAVCNSQGKAPGGWNFRTGCRCLEYPPSLCGTNHSDFEGILTVIECDENGTMTQRHVYTDSYIARINGYKVNDSTEKTRINR